MFTQISEIARKNHQIGLRPCAAVKRICPPKARQRAGGWPVIMGADLPPPPCMQRRLVV
jgi:hypothetical protein